ncbi:hypothetical protein N7510_002620 [Penicillium lagena]|uniref:uncharacterized protein n=1 Tax=Penicillium lagena TaxID=94218 RepID=UPI002541FE3D|nr:uncharacterized protein N7510_002620 [Penicillium lagena]KAJ5626311.1 hypothetical protein N7510_002620 [Penicillium lagena]
MPLLQLAYGCFERSTNDYDQLYIDSVYLLQRLRPAIFRILMSYPSICPNQSLLSLRSTHSIQLFGFFSILLHPGRAHPPIDYIITSFNPNQNISEAASYT